MTEVPAPVAREERISAKRSKPSIRWQPTARPARAEASSTSNTKLLLPLPETPVTVTKPEAGSSMSRPWRLWTEAPWIRTCSVAAGTSRGEGRWRSATAVGVVAFGVKTSATAPCATTWPPSAPAPGPSSIR